MSTAALELPTSRQPRPAHPRRAECRHRPVHASAREAQAAASVDVGAFLGRCRCGIDVGKIMSAPMTSAAPASSEFMAFAGEVSRENSSSPIPTTQTPAMPNGEMAAAATAAPATLAMTSHFALRSP